MYKMKFAVVTILIVGVALIDPTKAATKEERKKIFEGIAQNCQAQENATKADLAELYKHMPPTTDTGKCLRACLFEAFGAVQSGSLQCDVIVEYVAKETDHVEVNSASRGICNECELKLRGQSRCELAGNFAHCSIDAIKELGFVPAEVYNN